MIKFAPPLEEEIGLIQGQTPDSKYEFWVSEALYRYEIPFMYQFQILGGRELRGGKVVDFLVWNPDATPLEVFGLYWHKSELPGGDRVGLDALRSYFGKEPIVLWATDAQTRDDVFRFVRTEVAR